MSATLETKQTVRKDDGARDAVRAALTVFYTAAAVDDASALAECWIFAGESDLGRLQVGDFEVLLGRRPLRDGSVRIGEPVSATVAVSRDSAWIFATETVPEDASGSTSPLGG